MKNAIKVIHIPEICKYNEFINRTSEIQNKVGIDVISANICIDGDNVGTNELEDALKYKISKNDKMIIHFHWPEKLYKQIEYEKFKKSIIELKNNNVKLVKTIHNLNPHEMIEDDKNKEEFLLNELDGIILFSNSQLEAYKKKIDFKGKIDVIPHPNYKIQGNYTIKNTEGQYVLCVPGRIRKYKQTQIILNVLDSLKDINVKVVVVGKPDDVESVEMLKKYSGKNLECNFNFVSSKDLEDYIINSDMVLLTHKEIWTSGIAILAANLGKTLVGTLPKVFEDYDKEKIGYFLKSGDRMTDEKMVKLIRQAIDDGKEKNYEKGMLLGEILSKNNKKIIGNLYKEYYEDLYN